MIPPKLKYIANIICTIVICRKLEPVITSWINAKTIVIPRIKKKSFGILILF